MSSACSYGEERLAGLLYEDGDDRENIEMRSHLAECAECRAEFDSLASMKSMLSAWPNVVNVPRMVYVNESSNLLDRLKRWAADFGRPGIMAVLKPAAAAAVMVIVFVGSAALLDVRVAPDGTVKIGFGGPSEAEQLSAVAGAVAEDAAISRDEFADELEKVVFYMEELLQSRSDDQRQLMMAAIDERMQEQGSAMSQQLRGAVNSAFSDMQRQHEGDLGLVFSAIDELGVITGSELQRMNTILASLLQRPPDEEE